MSELKPCPFCGELPIQFVKDGLTQIRCNNTQCWIVPATSFYTDRKTAVEAWEERAQLENEPLTLEELHKELERLEELALATNGDAEETYTNGYRWGHRNGQIELLRRILNIGRGACESRCRKPERSDG